MNRRRNPLGRIPLSLIGALALVALFAFVTVRPPLPSLPRSLSQPAALWQVEEILLSVAWLGIVALLLLLLALIVRTVLQRSPPRVPFALRRDADRDPRRTSALPDALVRPNPLARPYLLTVATPQGERHPGPSARDDGGLATTFEAPRLDDRSSEQQQRRAVAIRVLGPPTIEGLPRRVRGLRTDCRLFLIYLALHPHGASRDEILAALWPDVPEGRARQRLYQAAADARSRLAEAFIAEGDRYWLDRERIAIDVDELDRLLHAMEIGRDGRERPALEEAFDLVRGPPLAGLDVPSLAGEARRLTAVVIDLCGRLAQARLADGDPAAALAAAERGIEYDELNEDLWRVALEAESVLGLREAVVTRYETLSRLLGERLGLEPARETRALYLELLGQS